jgi:methylmalonyl-CoA mutase cobalamin-binding domain/chain
MGFDVDMGPLFQSPKDVAKDAIENDVHAIGVSTLAAGHKTLVPELMKSLKQIDPKSKIVVFVGGVIPEQDYDFLYENNISAIFGPGSNIIESAETVIELISDKKIFGHKSENSVLIFNHFPFSSSVSEIIASTGHSGSQTPQSIHSSGLITTIFSPS